jgi:hypothetical protein
VEGVVGVCVSVCESERKKNVCVLMHVCAAVCVYVCVCVYVRNVYARIVIHTKKHTQYIFGENYGTHPHTSTSTHTIYMCLCVYV